MNNKNLIEFRKTEYNRAVAEANQQIKLFEAVKVEAFKLIEPPTNDTELSNFLRQTISYIKHAVELKYRHTVKLPISTEKLLEWLEMDLTPTINALSKVKTNLIAVEDVKLIPRVNIEDFKSYAETPEAVERLKLCKDLITAFKTLLEHNSKLDYYTEVHRLVESTNRRLLYDSYDLLKPNPNYVKSGKVY
jgi:hypothetical protein